MGLFRPYERTEKSERADTKIVGRTSEEPELADAPQQTASAKQRGAKKGPTPTRREAEAARMARLHPNLTPKELRKQQRERKYKARVEAWERVERSPEQVLMRDFVDARWTITEFLFPVFILVLAATFVTVGNPTATLYVSLALYTIFLMSIINIWLMWRSFKRLLADRLPKASRRGLLMAMINRAMMIRRFRRPAPRIRRGDDF
ncbi:DUF3043 domain-containing protein [Tessaracoccus sp. OH4464_COT-324]|uniref:DUF3043 domain-containing protein n=1 Tax=Tessaracoccus sp. OH4464_COT-324 TaxID=2491059 RepID=UPI000F62CFDC|nr:DUF3043 domain-containing protein [Tessaracoccus sp. OH4464_COT-324]RRD45765.1 DUF3043 domain-containing protein [Tessaracoccus sp. OH4464_COT-324]